MDPPLQQQPLSPLPHTVVSNPKDTPSQTSKLRLMVSYGGHILPRPHDKTLFYAGGDTRIVSLPRTGTSLSLSSLFSHLSKSLLNGSHSFSLKYQLPNHDLDSLISISSDEDLHNMIDEYDRLFNASLGSTAPSRIRFFLFKNHEDSLITSAAVAAANNSNNNNKHGVVFDEDGDCEWNVDAMKVPGSNPGGVHNNNNNNNNNNNMNNDFPETIVLESNSSFGSNASSSNSPANNKESSGDDFKVVLPSLDSFGSDGSIPSPNFSQQAIVYQDASGFIDSKPVSANLIETETAASDRSPQSDYHPHPHPLQVSAYMMSKPMDQPQHISSPLPQPSSTAPPPPHYIHHPNYVTQYYPGSIPVASYTPMYHPYLQSQQPVQYHHHLQKPYPVYMMPIGQSQNLYDASMPHPMMTAPNVATSQPQVPSSPVMIPPPMVYDGYNKAAPAPEYGANIYRPMPGHGVPSPMAPQPVSPLPIAPSLNQPAQSVTTPNLENTTFLSEYEDPMHAQIYKTQPSDSTFPSQLQMATSATTMTLSESFCQLKVENAKH